MRGYCGLRVLIGALWVLGAPSIAALQLTPLPTAAEEQVPALRATVLQEPLPEPAPRRVVLGLVAAPDVIWQVNISGITARLANEQVGSISWQVTYPLVPHQAEDGQWIAPENLRLVAMGLFIGGLVSRPEVDLRSTICRLGPPPESGGGASALILNGVFIGDAPGDFQQLFEQLVAWRAALGRGDQVVAQSFRDAFQALSQPPQPPER